MSSSRILWWGMTTNQRKRREILFEENLHKSKYYLRRFYTNPNIIWGGSTQIQILIEEILQKKTNIVWGKSTQIQIWGKSTQILTLFDEILHKSKHYLRRFSTNQTLFEEILHKSKYYLRKFSTNPNIILRKIYTNPNIIWEKSANPNIIWGKSTQIQILFEKNQHGEKSAWGKMHTNWCSHMMLYSNPPLFFLFQ